MQQATEGTLCPPHASATPQSLAWTSKHRGRSGHLAGGSRWHRTEGRWDILIKAGVLIKPGDELSHEVGIVNPSLDHRDGCLFADLLNETSANKLGQLTMQEPLESLLGSLKAPELRARENTIWCQCSILRGCYPHKLLTCRVCHFQHAHQHCPQQLPIPPSPMTHFPS